MNWKKPEGKKALIIKRWGKHIPPHLDFYAQDDRVFQENPLSKSEIAWLVNQFAPFGGNPTLQQDITRHYSEKGTVIRILNARLILEEIELRGCTLPLIGAGPAPLGDTRYIDFQYEWDRKGFDEELMEWKRRSKIKREELARLARESREIVESDLASFDVNIRAWRFAERAANHGISHEFLRRVLSHSSLPKNDQKHQMSHYSDLLPVWQRPVAFFYVFILGTHPPWLD